MASALNTYTLLSMDPHSRTRDDLVDAPGVHHVTHPFRCLARANRPRMEMCIVITAYNETWPDLKATIHGVMDNLSTLHAYTTPTSNGIMMPYGSQMNLFQGRAPPSKLSQRASTSELVALAPCINLRPEDILILVIFDGREKASQTLYGGPSSGCPLAPEDKQRMLDGLSALPVPIAQRSVDSSVRDCHLFEGEYNAYFSLTDMFPVAASLAFCLKEKNGGKLNSHAWGLRGLLPMLNPKCVKGGRPICYSAKTYFIHCTSFLYAPFPPAGMSCY